MKSMLNSPVKAFHPLESESPLSSPGVGGDAENTIEEGNLPAQLTRLMTKGRAVVFWVKNSSYEVGDTACPG